MQDARGIRVAARDLCWTNECRVSEDGRHFFVNETFGRRLICFDIAVDGTLSNRRIHAEFGFGIYPDGMAEDVEGAIWIASVISNTVLRVMPDGTVVTVLSDPDPRLADLEELYLADRLTRPVLSETSGDRLKNITSIAFGGSDLRTIYLGCLRGDALASFRVDVAGVEPPHFYR